MRCAGSTSSSGRESSSSCLVPRGAASPPFSTSAGQRHRGAAHLPGRSSIPRQRCALTADRHPARADRSAQGIGLPGSGGGGALPETGHGGGGAGRGERHGDGYGGGARADGPLCGVLPLPAAHVHSGYRDSGGLRLLQRGIGGGGSARVGAAGGAAASRRGHEASGTFFVPAHAPGAQRLPPDLLAGWAHGAEGSRAAPLAPAVLLAGHRARSGHPHRGQLLRGRGPLPHGRAVRTDPARGDLAGLHQVHSGSGSPRAGADPRRAAHRTVAHGACAAGGGPAELRDGHPGVASGRGASAGAGLAPAAGADQG